MKGNERDGMIKGNEFSFWDGGENLRKRGWGLGSQFFKWFL